MPISKLQQRWHKIWRDRRRLASFDPVFYVRRYPDLSGLTTLRAVQAHFLRHGSLEGRFANAQAEEEANYRQYLVDSPTFSLSAYRLLNPDLAALITTDRELILHFIRHGRQEGRLCTFANNGNAAPTSPWEAVFSVSQFSAWIGDGSVPLPSSRQAALAMFVAKGIEVLAPLAFDILFDPVFYRRRYGSAAGISDPELYRSWLDHGLVAGKAPNEGQFLKPYIGERAYPADFQWRAYANSRKLVDREDRCGALLFLLEQEGNWAHLNVYTDVEGQFIEALVRFKLRNNCLRDVEQIMSSWTSPDKPWLWALRGDYHAAMGQVEQARNAFEQSVSNGSATFTVFKNAVQQNLHLGDLDRALELLRIHRDVWIGQAAYERLVADCADMTFERGSAAAHALLEHETLETDDQRVQQMNVSMLKTLGSVELAIADLELGPGHFGAAAAGHTVLLANEDLRQCTHYRVEQRQEQFRAAGLELRRHAMADCDAFIADLLGATAAIFYRVPATPPIMRAILTARAMGIPTYYDIDDLIFCAESYPEPYAAYQSQIAPSDYRGLQFGVPLFRFAIGLCDYATASTKDLLDRMIPLVRKGRGLLVINGLDSRNEGTLLLGGTRSSVATEKVRIFYGSGTLAHNADFLELVVPALARLMSEQQNVDLVLIGHVPSAPALACYADRVLRFPMIGQIEDYWAILAACDINLAVLKPGTFADCKSEIKWLEAAAAGVVTVASGTTTHRNSIENGVDGYIADTPDGWYAALAMLSSDAHLRSKVGAAARTKAVYQYGLHRAAALWKTELGGKAELARPDYRRTRVLICNVFFSPQSIGGATRVVEDNVAHISAACPDLDLAVFCTDEGGQQPYKLRTSRFEDNVNVFRVSVPENPDVDSRVFDEAMIGPFRQVIDTFKPDLVHFHCIQRLTASVVQECLRMGIPYFITLHDAWWISSDQFLIDRDGLLHVPDDDLFAGYSDQPGAADAQLCRRQRLKPLLLGATQILSVSDRFAEVYRQAGILPVTVVANGLPDLPPPCPSLSPEQPLRLAHIGGRSSHKGADLVEAALRLGDYPNLQLLIVDGRLATGEKIETIWGTSKVTISGPWPQRAVAELYGSMDVLLAPSRWPESFGLVTREAAHFGVWIVASRMGALSDDIIEGANGYSIDTTDRKDLDRVLALLNGEPHRFRQGIASASGPMRTSRDQADGLARLYRLSGLV